MGASPQRRRHFRSDRPSALLLAPLLALLGTPALAGADLVAPNLVCDTRQQICYDAQGPSLNQTRRVFGDKAERNLLRLLSGRPPMTSIAFSNGALCDLAKRTCWDDGNRRTNISNRYTRQLFGGGATPQPGARSCLLSQRGRRLFEGTCSLTRRDEPGGAAYRVETQDGRRYVFFNEGMGRLVLRDATGSWPVVIGSSSSRVAFRWADVQLLVSRSAGGSGWDGSGGYGGYGGSGGYGSGFQSGGQDDPLGYPEPRSTGPATPGQALEQLLNGLFR